MLNRKTTARAGNHWLLVAFALPISACMAYNDTTSDVDRTPIMNAGTRAGIIYPGQGAPAMPGSVPQTQYAPPGTGSQYGQPPVPERQAPPPIRRARRYRRVRHPHLNPMQIRRRIRIRFLKRIRRPMTRSQCWVDRESKKPNTSMSAMSRSW